MQRRTFLQLSGVSALALTLVGGASAWLQAGLDGGRLSPGGREVFRGVGRAVLAGSLPADGPARLAALDGLLHRIDGFTCALPPHAQDELSQLLSLLAGTPGRRALAGLSEGWPAASEADIQQALQGMRLSDLALRQQAYAALHDITTAAYFSDASTWSLLGYPGPQRI